MRPIPPGGEWREGTVTGLTHGRAGHETWVFVDGACYLNGDARDGRAARPWGPGSHVRFWAQKRVLGEGPPVVTAGLLREAAAAQGRLLMGLAADRETGMPNAERTAGAP